MAGHGNPNSDFPSVTALFHRSAQEVLFPKTACSVCSQSHRSENRPHPKTHVENNFILSFCPGCELKSPFFVIVGKFMHHRNFVREHFQIHSKYSFTECWDIPYSWATFRTDFQSLCWIPTQSTSTASGCRTVGVCRRFCSFTLPSSSNFLTKQSIVFPAGAHQVWKIVWNLLCMVVTLHFSKQNNSFGTLLNCRATMIDYFTELPLPWGVHWFVRLYAMEWHFQKYSDNYIIEIA